MIIDWLSATIPFVPVTRQHLIFFQLKEAVAVSVPALDTYLDERVMKPVGARRPYEAGWRKDGITAYGGCGIDHALIDISGLGCASLRKEKVLKPILASLTEGVTRLDIAIDLPDVTPDEIIEAGHARIFRTKSRIVSDTGTTIYLGSQKSDRYCRVYRYASPHPRAELCRIEMVHRKEYAKTAAKSIREHGLQFTTGSALEAYKFEHGAVCGHDGQALATTAIVKSSQNTLRWLLVQVAPAFKRLVEDGTITDAESFLREHFLLTDESER